jgi:hypothetical protein
MANLNVALRQLREERRQAQTHIERLDQAIAAIEGMGARSNSRRAGLGGRSRLSPAARRRIAAAQRARWARHRQQTGTSSARGTAAAKSAKPAKPAKRRLSAAARRRIAAAQKARWAKFRAKQQKAQA